MPAALFVVAAIALRGSPPGGGQSEDPPRTLSETAELVLLVALIAVSLALFIVALRSRNRSPAASAPEVVPEWLRDRLRARTVLIVGVAIAVAVAGWLLLIRLLPAWQPTDVGTPPPGPPDVAEPAVPRTPPPAARPPDALDGAAAAVLAGATLISVLLMTTGIVLVRRDRRTREPATAVPEGGGSRGAPSDSLVRAAELGLAEVGDLSREPRAAIIACYATMERELARVPGMAPRDFDTASEVLARAVDNLVLRSDSAAPLVDLFEEARFSPHVMDETHRDNAVRALRLVLAELGDPAREKFVVSTSS